MTLKKIKMDIFHRNKKAKLVSKLVEEMAELQKELLKGRYSNAIQEMGDVKALIKMFEITFGCKKETKASRKASLKKWKGLL